MASVRNLRNLVLSGVDKEHVTAVCKYLSNEKAVGGSRMFPFRFFTAFDVLDDLDRFCTSTLTNTKPRLKSRKEALTKEEKDVQQIKLAKLKKRQATMNKDAIAPFRRALEQAVAVATAQNVPPLKGRTLVLVATGKDMDKDFGGAKGVVRKGTELRQAALLFALMAASSSEDCRLVAYCGVGSGDLTADVPEAKDSLLKGVQLLDEKVTERRLRNGGSSIGSTVLEGNGGLLWQMLADRDWIDNLVVLPGLVESTGGDFDELKKFSRSYRHLVNPDMVLACVSLEGARRGVRSAEEDDHKHPNDFFVSGFSETIFQCMASLSDGGQVEMVESADRRHRLAPPVRRPFENVLPLELAGDGSSGGGQEWKRIRIFVSSTFRDMHGERDLLNRYVLPELRRRARALHLDVQMVDLRWGVTTTDSDEGEDFMGASHSLLAASRKDGGISEVLACLREAWKCQLFVGLLGERYGWKPGFNLKLLEQEVERGNGRAKELLEMLKTGMSSQSLEELGSMSVTEIEMETVGLVEDCDEDVAEAAGKAFFFLRDGDRLTAQLNRTQASDFACGSDGDTSRLAKLKDKIRGSGMEVFDGYPSRYGGVIGGKPVAAGLEEFGQRMVDVLWNALSKIAKDREEEEVKEGDGRELSVSDQEAFCADLVRHHFVSRAKVTGAIRKLVEEAAEKEGGLVEVQGKPGSGTTSILSKIYKDLSSQAKKRNLACVPFFAGAVPPSGQRDQVAFLRYLATQLGRLTGSRSLQLPTDLKALGVKVASLLMSAASAVTSANKNRRLLVVVDGAEDFGKTSSSHSGSAKSQVEWLPPALPKGVIVVVSSYSGSPWSKQLQQRKEEETGHSVFRMPALDMPERKSLARHFLGQMGKRLEEGAFDNQLGHVVSKRDAGNAGYLRLLTTEVAGLGIFEELGQRLVEAGGTARELLLQVLSRCEDEMGSDCVSSALSILAVSAPSGSGLTDFTLREAMRCLSLLAQKPDFTKKKSREVGECLVSSFPTAEEFLPTANLSVLLNVLDGFLQPTEQSLMEGLLLLKPGPYEEAVREKYLGGSEGARKEDLIHRVLAATLNMAYRRVVPGDPLVLDSLPYHLARSGQIKDLEETLCDLAYVQRCATAGILPVLTRHLMGIHVQVRSLKERFTSSPKVRDFLAFIRLNDRELLREPCLTVQLAACDAPDSFVAAEARACLESGKRDKSGVLVPPVTFAWTNCPPRSERPLRSSKNFRPSAEMTAMVVERSAAIRPEELLAAQGFSDGGVIVCLAQSGVDLFSLVGHAAPVTALAFLPGGSGGETCLASGSADGALSFWDLNARVRLASFPRAHSRALTGLAASADGLTLVSVGWDGLIKIWAGRTRQETSCIRQKNGPMNAVEYHPEKDCIVVGNWEGLLKIYDITSLERKAVLRGHQSSVQAVSLLCFEFEKINYLYFRFGFFYRSA